MSEDKQEFDEDEDEKFRSYKLDGHHDMMEIAVSLSVSLEYIQSYVFRYKELLKQIKSLENESKYKEIECKLYKIEESLDNLEQEFDIESYD